MGIRLRSFDDGWAHGWNVGAMNTREFARQASEHISLPPEQIVSHMHKRCRHIEFFEFTFAFYLRRHLPQAIVTVNPDLWTKVVVPLYEFDKTSDAIVSSWQERSADNAVLCKIALERLGLQCLPSEALLIDNKQSNVDAWAACGGATYLYTSDGAFLRDVSRGIDSLVHA